MEFIFLTLSASGYLLVSFVNSLDPDQAQRYSY